MTRDPFWCPKEGCDYGSGSEQKSKAAVRSHINASTDHDWPGLKPLVEQQADQEADSESTTDQEESDDEPGDEEETTSDGEQQVDDSKQAESKDMVSDEEYEQAHSDTANPDADDSDTDTNQSSDPVGEMLPTLDTSTIVLGLAILGTVVVLWILLGDSSDDEQQEPTPELPGSRDGNGWSPQDIEEAAA